MQTPTRVSGARPSPSPYPQHRRIAAALAVAGLAAFGSLGCGRGESLESIRERQAAGRFESTIEPLRELLQERPGDAELNYLYGVALAATQQTGLAAWALSKAMEDPDWTVEAGNQLAFAALTTSDFNEVVDVTTRVLERDPDNLSALLLRAKAHAHWRKDPAQALADADRVLELNPDAIEAIEPRILALLGLERFEEANAALDELGRRMQEVEAPEGTRAWHCATTAVFAEDAGDSARAEQLWAECLADFPADPGVVWPALRSLEAQRQGERVIEVLRAALAAEPPLAVAQSYRVLLADRLRLAGRAAEGEALLEEAASVDDPATAAEAWMSLARFRQSLGEPLASAEAIERAIELLRGIDGIYPQIQFEYADALVLAGRLDRASEVAGNLTVPAHRHMIRARVAQEQGNPARALEEFDAGFRLWPNNPWARYYAARAAEDLGDFERALEEYYSSIRVDPAATDARTRAGRMLMAEGRLRPAAQMLRDMDHKPLDRAGRLLAIRLAARGGTLEDVDRTYATLLEDHPGALVEGAVEAATGLAQGKGPAAALELLRALAFDYRDPRSADALREIVRNARRTGEHAGPIPELEAALAAHPDAAAFQAIRGLDLELRGEADAAGAAYARALEHDPDHPPAQVGLGRLALEAGDPERARAVLERAVAADPGDREAALLAARALIASGRAEAAGERLDALLVAHPYEAEAAQLRASLDLERGEPTPRTLERARRAVRFGGGIAALELLERVHAARGDDADAARAARRAAALREREAAGDAGGEREEADSADSPRG